jgi:threonine aldolase
MKEKYYLPYGNDELDQKARALVASIFDTTENRVAFVPTGTAANCLALKAILKPYGTVICADSAHINTDECGAPEATGGYKLTTVHNNKGKLDTSSLEELIKSTKGEQRKSQPMAISISQPTEFGTIYSFDELSRLKELAHHHGLLIHMDGARLCNAVFALQQVHPELDYKAVAKKIASFIDVLSFGLTKNGAIEAEAVVFMGNQIDTTPVQFLQKQLTMVVSKTSFISLQFLVMLEDDLWIKNAKISNDMARTLSQKLKALKLDPVYPVEANAIIIELENTRIKALEKHYHFYIWQFGQHSSHIRFMTNFLVTHEDINMLLATIERIVKDSVAA